MRFIIGVIIIIASIAIGYGAHGDFKVLWQPLEFLIICGAAVGSFAIGNPGHVIKDTVKTLKNILKPSPYKKSDYLELITFLFSIFKLAKTKGLLELESHIENPHDSALFNQYPKFAHNHHAVDFFCDYIRMLTMGFENPYQLEDMMNDEIDIHHHEAEAPSGAVNKMADAFPALGIVAAVLGVIVTMGSISEPPEVLGKLIGAALVGTFAGVLISYGFVAPMASAMAAYAAGDTEYLKVIKAGILAHVKGNAPAISAEFARKAVPGHFRPSFKEVDDALNAPAS